MKNSKKTAVIAIVLVMAVAVMGFGFAAWQSELNGNGTVQTNASWDVEFINCVEANSSNAKWINNGGTDKGTISPDGLTLDLGTIEISQPGGFMVLDVTVENKGSIDADLTSANLEATGIPEGYTVKLAEGFDKDEPILKAGKTCTFSVLVKANDDITETQFYELNVYGGTLPSGISKGEAVPLTLALVYNNNTTNSSYTTQHSHVN